MMVIDDGCNVKNYNIPYRSVHKTHINLYILHNKTYNTTSSQAKTLKIPTMHTQ